MTSIMRVVHQSKFHRHMDEEEPEEPSHLRPTYLVCPEKPNNSSLAFSGAMQNTLVMTAYSQFHQIRRKSPIVQVREYRKKGD